jgi:sec-independent protein translocase protein TatB
MTMPQTIQFASLGMADSLILMVMALVVFGPRRLPQIGRQIGKLMYEFRKASNDFKFQMEEELRNAEEADRRKQEEERLKTLALAAPAPAVDATPAPAAWTHDPVPDGQFPSPSPYPGEEAYPPIYPPPVPETPVEETALRIQPPSTGEQVPAARPGSLAAQIQAMNLPGGAAEAGPAAVPEPAAQGSTDLDIPAPEAPVAAAEEPQPVHPPPEAGSVGEPPLKGPTPADFDDTRAHAPSLSAEQNPPVTGQAVHHG